MDDVVREVNTRVLWKGLELVDANSYRFEMNLLLIAYYTVLYSKVK